MAREGPDLLGMQGAPCFVLSVVVKMHMYARSTTQTPRP